MLKPQKYPSNRAPEELAAIKSQVINIFRANPWLSRFYLGFFQLRSRNPSLYKNIQVPPEIFIGLNLAPPNPKGHKSMSLNKNIRICTHVKVDGLRCGSPALRGEVFCYFHQRMIRGVATPPKSRLHPIALIENEESIQASLMEVINALIRNTIDVRRAQLILRALHIAVRNSPRVHFQLSPRDMVREAPEYPAAPELQKPTPPVLAQAGALQRIRPPKPVSVARPKATIDPERRKPPASVRPPAPARVLAQAAAQPEHRRSGGVA